jgi:hypothetical protein
MAASDGVSRKLPPEILCHYMLQALTSLAAALDKAPYTSVGELEVVPRPNGNWPLPEIFGVVRNVSQARVSLTSEPEIYLPCLEQPAGSTNLVVRTTLDEEAVLGNLRRTMDRIDGSIPIYSLTTGEQLVSRSAAQPRLLSIVLLAFAVLASAISTMGLYSVHPVGCGIRHQRKEKHRCES